MSRDFWNERFGGEAYVYGEAPNDFLVASAGHLPPGGRVLSLSEGEGRNAVFLAGQGFDVTGVDYAEAGRPKALALAARHGVSIDYAMADLADYPVGIEAWDGVVGIFCHLPSTLRADLFARLRQGLRPGGVMVMELYHPDQLAFGTGGPKDPDLLSAPEDLLPLLDGFEILHAARLEREVVEGSFHTGRAAVTQLIARKPT